MSSGLKHLSITHSEGLYRGMPQPDHSRDEFVTYLLIVKRSVNTCKLPGMDLYVQQLHNSHSIMYVMNFHINKTCMNAIIRVVKR